MKKTVFLVLLLMLVTALPVFAEVPTINCRAHVQDVGWTDVASDPSGHTVLGTVGQSKRIEAIQLSTSDPNLQITYNTHVQDIGWMQPTTGGVSGTEGQAKKIEAFNISLAGANAQNYDLYYRTHVEDYGWLDWTTSGSAGTTNHNFRCEALELKLQEKGQPAPGSTEIPAVEAFTREEGIHMHLVNMLRLRNGRGLLTGNQFLHQTADYRVMDLPLRFSHYRPNGAYYDSIVKYVFPGYRLNAGGFTETITFGAPRLADPVESFNVVNIYPHEAVRQLEGGAKYFAWSGLLNGTMGYSVQLFSGLDSIDFAY